MKLPYNFFSRHFPQRIWHQIFFILVFLVIIPLVILGLLLINTSQRAIKTTVLRDHKQVAIHTTGEVREHIEGARESLLVTASILGTLHADPWRQETSIVELSLRNPAYKRVASLDSEGQEIASSELGTELKSRSEEEAFQHARLGQSYLSPVKISEDRVPYLTIAEPVKQLGKVKGVLVADINLRSVWDIVDAIQFGELGKAYLIDQKGRVIAHPDKKLVLQNANIADTNIIRDVIAGQVGNAEDVDPQGDRWLISYAPIEKLNWGLIITQPEKEAYAFSKTMKIQSWVLIGLSILATVVISLILSQIMSRPVHTLVKATRNVANRDFDRPLRVARRDEIGRLFRSFNKMTAKLKQAERTEKLSTIGKAATAIAHELRNSLVSVNTYIRLLPERHKDKNFVDEFSQTVPQELDSWKNMLQNMIDYAKFLQFEMKDVDINSLINDVAALAYQRGRQKNVDFRIRTNENLPRIKGNEDKLRQVFLNLINNALEATPSGGTITLSTDLLEGSELRPSPQIQVKVDDTGEGIQGEQLNRVFDPFYTTKNDGLGLGLSISQEIVNLHGGRIEVLSEQHKGTSFKVNIPTHFPIKKG